MKARHSYSLVVLFGIAGFLAVTGCKNGTTGNDPSEPDPQGEAPAIPSGLTADAGDGEIILSWNANSEANLSHYNVYQGEASGGLYHMAEVPAGTEIYTAGDLENGTTYYFAINAENDDGQVSEMTGEMNALPQKAEPVRLETGWTMQFGSPGDDGFGDPGMALDGDGILWVASSVSENYEGITGPILCRFNSEDGTRISIESLDGLSGFQVRPTSIAFTSDGGYTVAGITWGALADGTRTGVSDAFVAKYDNTGTFQWVKQTGATGKWTAAHAVAVSDSDDIFVAGNISEDAALPGQTSSGGGRDVFLMKFDVNGESEWIRQFGNGSDRLWAHGVTILGDDIHIMGTVADSGAPVPGSESSGNSFIKNYNASGDELSALQFDTPIGSNESGGMVLDNQGALWVFGGGFDPFDYGGEGGRDFVMAEVEPETGKILTAAQLGTPQNEWGGAITLGANGEVYAGGTTNGSFPGHTNAGGYDIVILKLERP